jgi:Arc/MetJ family transcription regulator
MRTNIDIDDKLLAEVIKWEGIKSKKELVQIAFQELVKLRKRNKMKSLQGKVIWEGNLEQMRKYDKWDNR